MECPGVYYINFKNGYESFVRKAVDLLPEGVLRVNTQLLKIIWKRDDTNEKVFEYINDYRRKPKERIGDSL